MTCTTPECETPTETYLCTQCVSDLQARIDSIHFLLPEMDVAIARLDVTRPGNPETKSSNDAGSAAPANLDAIELKARMLTVTNTAAEYALMDHAAGTAWIIAEWETKAEAMISGPQEPRIDHAANKERIKEIAPPMTTRELLPWIRANARIAITSMDIRNWARRGKLTPVEREPSPTYWPHEVIQAHKEARE